MIRRNRTRDKIKIICQILEVTNGCETKKIQIMYKANLSYAQLKEHLIFLTEKDLLHYHEDTLTFKATEKGLRFLQIYNHIDQMIKKEQPSLIQQQMGIQMERRRRSLT